MCASLWFLKTVLSASVKSVGSSFVQNFRNERLEPILWGSCPSVKPHWIDAKRQSVYKHESDTPIFSDFFQSLLFISGSDFLGCPTPREHECRYVTPFITAIGPHKYNFNPRSYSCNVPIALNGACLSSRDGNRIIIFYFC